MVVELSSELQHALDQGVPLKLIDPRTGKGYVLVESPPEANGDLAETYRAQIESAWRAGWDDPAMDDYNDYDRHRK